jgi:hypothetical protein
MILPSMTLKPGVTLYQSNKNNPHSCATVHSSRTSPALVQTFLGGSPHQKVPQAPPPSITPKQAFLLSTSNSRTSPSAYPKLTFKYYHSRYLRQLENYPNCNHGAPVFRWRELQDVRPLSRLREKSN